MSDFFSLICTDAAEFLSHLPKYSRLLGIDAGEKTLGLALSDNTRMIATPHSTLRRGKFSDDAKTLFAIVAEQEVGGLVLGLPVNMDGSEGPRVQSTRALARNLYKIKQMPILLWDERLSTVAVTRTMLEADLSRERRKELVDKMAASYLLQGALDHFTHLEKQ